MPAGRSNFKKQHPTYSPVLETTAILLTPANSETR